MRCLLIAALAWLAGNAAAEVIDSDQGGFTSAHEIVIAASRERVYQALTAEVGHWWDPRHSYGGQAANFTIDPKPGGCFCETLPDGGGVEHMRVVFVEPNKILRLAGGLGPLQSMAVSGAMQFTLTTGDKGATKISYRYTVGGYYPQGLDTVAAAVDLVQLGQLQRLKRYVETGDPESHGT